MSAPLSPAGLLRLILLERPAAIEGLQPAKAEALGRLLEANKLEPLLYDRLKEQGESSLLSPARLVSWKNAYLLAVARAAAFGEARREIEALAEARQLPLRLLGATQLAGQVYPKAELRPLATLDIQAPPNRAGELDAALRSRRFSTLEDLREGEEASRATRCSLPLLSREGVAVKIFIRSTPRLPAPPWDPFAGPRPAPRPELLAAEPLILLISQDLADRRFFHSLLGLHDLHLVVTQLEPDWNQLLALAGDTQWLIEPYASLFLLRELLGSPVDQGFLAELKGRIALAAGHHDLLLRLARTALFQQPGAPRLPRLLGKLLEEAQIGSRALSAP